MPAPTPLLPPWPPLGILLHTLEQLRPAFQALSAPRGKKGFFALQLDFKLLDKKDKTALETGCELGTLGGCIQPAAAPEGGSPWAQVTFPSPSPLGLPWAGQVRAGGQ